MIKANELRIGNIVYFCNSETNRFENILPIEDGFEIQNILNGELIVEPIQLTPEILEKVGFEKSDKDLFIFQLHEIYIEYVLDDSKYYLSANQGEYWIGDGITQVHQLQNLYFALTGEELNINL